VEQRVSVKNGLLDDSESRNAEFNHTDKRYRIAPDNWHYRDTSHIQRRHRHGNAGAERRVKCHVNWNLAKLHNIFKRRRRH